jgi:hypothetical protein
MCGEPMFPAPPRCRIPRQSLHPLILGVFRGVGIHRQNKHHHPDPQQDQSARFRRRRRALDQRRCFPGLFPNQSLTITVTSRIEEGGCTATPMRHNWRFGRWFCLFFRGHFFFPFLCLCLQCMRLRSSGWSGREYS